MDDFETRRQNSGRGVKSLFILVEIRRDVWDEDFTGGEGKRITTLE